MGKLLKDFNREDLESILKVKTPSIYIELASTHYYNPGLFIFFIQVLCTRIRNTHDIEISTNLETKVAEKLPDHLHHYYHLLTLILFKVKINIVDKNGFMLKRDVLYTSSIVQFNIQEEFYALEFGEQEFLTDSSNAKIDALRKRVFSDRSFNKINEGVSFFIPCFDHVKPLRRSSYFYDLNGTLRIREEVSSWVRKIFEFNKLNIRVGIQRNKTHNEISLVIKELFDNTEEWARTTYDKREEYKPNLRACFINIYMEKRLLQLSDNNDDKTRQYISEILKSDLSELRIPNWQTEIHSRSKVGICEISVLDMGPGMARRWLRKDYGDISYQEEVNAVTEYPPDQVGYLAFARQ